MGEMRKRKSAWDEDDSVHMSGMSEHSSWKGNDRRSSHDSRHYHEVSESRTRKPRDDSGYPAWDTIEEHPIAPMNISNSFKNTQDDNEFEEGKRYYKNMSPGYERMERHNYNDSHGYDQSHSQRYLGRGRSRSRSSSLSRDRERERRSGWTRSRSRNQYDVRTNDYNRSRSPINERLSYEWSERRSVPEKSSQICRNVSAGSCRHGSQCRFLHPNTTSRRERDLLEEEPFESWRGRTDHSHVPRHSYNRASSGFESRNEFSDTYHEDRMTLPCKNFLNGNCRWGDACRYFHPSDDFDKGKSGRPLCKFYAAGMCIRENCRFSHEYVNNDRRREVSRRRVHEKLSWSEDPTWDNPAKISDPSDKRGEVKNNRTHDRDNLWDNANEISHMNDRRGEFSDGRSRYKGNRLDTPTWDNAAKISETNDKRGEDIDGHFHEKGNWSDISTLGDATKISDSGDEQIDRRLENENKNWGMKKHALFGGNMGFAEPIAKENMAYKQERLISDGSEFQGHDGTSNVEGQNALRENIDPPPHIQDQHCRVVEDNQKSSLGSYVLDEVKETTITHPIPFSGLQNTGSIFLGHSSISGNSDRGQNILLPNPPSVFCADLNEPNTEVVDPLNVPVHTQNKQKSSQSPPGFLESNPQLLTDLLAKKLSDQAANSRSLVNKKHPQTHTEMPSFPANSDWAPLVNTLTVQPNLGSNTLDLNSTGNSRENAENANPRLPALSVQPNLCTNTVDLNSTGNGRENAEYANLSLPTMTVQPNLGSNTLDLGTSALNLPQGTEHKQSSPLSAEGPPGFDSINVRAGDVAANSEVTRGNEVFADKGKGVEANEHPETQNGHEKVEEGSGVNRDEKGTRLFKSSLVEFVKEILKPTWKEGRMSRDDHKTVVKKVVDKVSSTVQADHIPKTQEKIDQYLACSKPKITKLVQAYVQRYVKKDS